MFKKIINPYVFEEKPWVIKRYTEIASFAEGEKLLDVGCGKGRLKIVIKKEVDLYGIDVSEKNIEICKNLGYKSVLRINIDQEKKLPFEDKYFSTIFCLDVLEHLYDPIWTLKELNRTLKDGGKIIISCPNIGFLFFRILLLFGVFSDIEIPQKIINSHIRFYTIRRMKNVLKFCGFKTKKKYGFTPTPFSKIIAGVINFLARLLPKLFGYNFVIVAEKTSSPQKSPTMIEKSIFKQIITAIKWG